LLLIVEVLALRYGTIEQCLQVADRDGRGCFPTEYHLIFVLFMLEL
jgi:hypothetical protein